MTLLDREVIPPSVSTKGIIYSAFLLLLVVSLFFIPEIVRFQETVTKSKKIAHGVSQNVSSVNIDEILPSKSSHSSLDKILSAVSGNGAPSDARNPKDVLSIEAPSNPSPSDSQPDAGSANALKEIQDKVMLEKTFANTSFATWDQLNSPEVRRAFHNAQGNATKILKGLNSRQSAIRFALINYINGLGWLTRGDRKIMSADEAVAYLEQLDINVTQAMLTSEIDAADFESWKRISFGPLTLNSRASAFKLGVSITFNPRLTLTSVEIQNQYPYVLRRNGTWAPRQTHSSMRLAGFVMGKDIKKIVVYRNGRRETDLRISRDGNDDGLRAFKWRYRAADGLFTFRVYSQGGDISEKNYVFLNKVAGRFRQDQDGYYLLPFGSDDSGSVSLRNLDTRLDKFFRVIPRGGQSNSNPAFDTF